ncbi:MAG: hypothetical protein J6W75_02605 [Bacteroidaceae bacterium]|nr:hypothetical protein [Bacteroidaceae bacterium]
MNALSLNNLWSYLQGLSLTASNKKWLAAHLYEAAEAETTQQETLQKARDLTEEQLQAMAQEEFLSPEDLKLLLYRTVDNIYSQV